MNLYIFIFSIDFSNCYDTINVMITNRRDYMGEEIKIGCARPELTKPLVEEVEKEKKTISNKEEQRMVKVGKPAPLFTAPAFYEGKFTNVSLEDYKGKWVLLCFYPGDFTFV